MAATLHRGELAIKPAIIHTHTPHSGDSTAFAVSWAKRLQTHINTHIPRGGQEEVIIATIKKKGSAAHYCGLRSVEVNAATAPLEGQRAPAVQLALIRTGRWLGEEEGYG